MPVSRILSPLLSLRKGNVVLAGSFDGNGASAPTVIDFKGVSAVARPATGRYELVLPGTGTLRVTSISVVLLSTSGRTATVRSYTPSTRTLVIDVYDLATPSQQNLTTSEKCFVTVIAKNSASDT
jgi:hypothetical protein